MKNRVEQLVNAKFEYEVEQLLIDPDQICMKTKVGRTVQGSFFIETPSRKKIKGFIYSSNPRILLSATQFYGTRTMIRYQADVSGMLPGSREEGNLTVCSELGEKKIPYQIEIQKEDTGAGLPVKDLSEFTGLAKENFQYAYRIFLSEEFSALLAEDPEAESWYRALRKETCSYETLEYFLTGTGRKEAVEITAAQDKTGVLSVREEQEAELILYKKNWGFQKITVTAEELFLAVAPSVITTDEFTGDEYKIQIKIRPESMHAGKNLGRIRIQTETKRQDIPVEAEKTDTRARDRARKTQKEQRKKMEILYIRFRLRKISRESWMKQSLNLLDQYAETGGNDLFAKLFRVQLLFGMERKKEAIQVMKELEQYEPREGKMRNGSSIYGGFQNSTQYAFYEYLTTFFCRREEYVNMIQDRIEALHLQNPTDWIIQWILLYLDETLLQEEEKRYQAVAKQFRLGCRSRIMYLEAYVLIEKNPFYLRRLGKFELQLLWFAAKEKVLSEEIMHQAEELALHVDHYEELLVRILEKGYECTRSTEAVRALCVVMMKGDRRDETAFFWYQKGVEKGLRLTGLYEYYMEASKECDLEQMPQVIRMFFRYDTSLSYQRRAEIYCCMLLQKEQKTQVYHSFRPAIQRFTTEQLEEGHVTGELAVLYREILRKEMLRPALAERLFRILNSYELTELPEDVREITVSSLQIREELRVSVRSGKARIWYCDPRAVILAHREDGSCYPIEKEKAVRLMESEKLLGWAVETGTDSIGVMWHVSQKAIEKGELSKKILPVIQNAEQQDFFSEEYRKKLRTLLLSYYEKHVRDDSLREFLEKISFGEYVAVDKTILVMLLAEEGMCEKAFEMLERYGMEGIHLIQLVKICSRMVIATEFEENRMLLSLCFYCFHAGKYDDNLLRYLLLYYEGPVEEMMDVWQAGINFELDTMLLEEKIMRMILFTRSKVQGTEAVFESYRRKMGRKKLCIAYGNLKAYEYFVQGLSVGKPVFEFFVREYLRLQEQENGEKMEDICSLALLQHLSCAVQLSDQEKRIAEELLEEFSLRGLRFGFWKKFDPQLLAPYQMEGKVFAEYVGNPESIVSIWYRKQKEKQQEEVPFVKERMKNGFEGVFVKEFTLFDGEKLECYMEEEYRGESKTSGRRILTAGTDSDGPNTKYELIGRMERALESGDEKKFREELETFLLQQYLSEQVFTLY